MKQILIKGGLPLLAMVSLSGCFDNNYDLSDIDTTSQFKVKDLIVPVNLDPITMGDIFDIKDGDKIQVVNFNGQSFYAINEKGSFSSNPVEIPGFSSPAPSIPSATIDFETGGIAVSAGRTLSISLPGTVKRSVVYNATNVHQSIVSLDDIYTDNLTFNIRFEVNNVPEGVNLSMNDIVMVIPRGLEIESMNPQGFYSIYSGKYTVRTVPIVDGVGEFSITVSKINLPSNGSYIENGNLTLTSDLNITSANLVVSAQADVESLPDILTVETKYTLSDLNVKAITGQIEYTFDGSGMDIAPIDLSDIPDFLAGEETNLVLANPQIYLSVNNPLANLEWDYVSGFSLTAVRGNGESKEFSLDYGQIGVGHDKPIEDMYQFRLSPDLQPDKIYLPEGYENPEFVEFSTLGNVLSGEGLPDKIEINLINPHLLKKEVNKFLLNTKFPSLKGNWELMAPLALSDSEGNRSQIIYTHTADGWSSSHLNAVTIEQLEVSMTVDNDLPLEATLTGYPIDINGKQIRDVSVEGAVVPANAKNHEVKLYITGEVKYLDGISFKAVVYPTTDNAITPSQTLTLNNVRAKVSGNYTKEL